MELCLTTDSVLIEVLSLVNKGFGWSDWQKVNEPEAPELPQEFHPLEKKRSRPARLVWLAHETRWSHSTRIFRSVALGAIA